MKTIFRNFLVVIGLISLNTSCEQEETPVPGLPIEVVQSKLKSISHYSLCGSIRPDEKFLFFYDEIGRLESYDLYIPDMGSEGMVRYLHFALEYKVEAPNPLYIVKISFVNNPGVIVGRRKVYLDANSNYVRDIIYDGGGENVLIDNVYTHYDGGFSVLTRMWLNDYQQFGNTKIAFDTDANGNVTNKRIYNSHFEGSDVEEHVEAEFVYTHDSNANPLFNLTPYFSGIAALNKYPDSESVNNVATITPVGCEDCTTEFSYKYENGLVSEITPGGHNLFRRTFEYY
jgi:hypothetical protein